MKEMTKKKVITTVMILGVFMILFVALGGSNQVKAIPLYVDSFNDYFPDDNLAIKVAEIVHKQPTDIMTGTDIDNITMLDASNSNISSIEGLGVLTNLNIINLSGNEIKSIPAQLATDLGGLNLLAFSLSDCNIIDLPFEFVNHDWGTDILGNSVLDYALQAYTKSITTTATLGEDLKVPGYPVFIQGLSYDLPVTFTYKLRMPDGIEVVPETLTVDSEGNFNIPGSMLKYEGKYLIEVRGTYTTLNPEENKEFGNYQIYFNVAADDVVTTEPTLPQTGQTFGFKIALLILMAGSITLIGLIRKTNKEN
ncbi:MAG: hypothetical protein PHQ32_03560 [Firmicutes bacterium]|nr:hypothetical protein [Bacillota bacterium]